MKHLCILFLLLTPLPLLAADRPNILWITSEDNGAHWLGCYGNAQAQTPNLDAMAANGIRFQNAYSNAPVCAVARSTLLRGAYATTTGTQHMRSSYPVEERFVPYVTSLREAGYYCTNAKKTDYNAKMKDRDLWDSCGKNAHYRKRKDKDQPFFAIFNIETSHESSLFPYKKPEPNEQLPPEKVIVPPYLPDLPEIRSDIAVYHRIIGILDGQVGGILKELEEQGHAEDTIVFYYSDHGGVLPRGKRYLKDTGLKVPMIVHFPEKWAHLSPFKAGSAPEEPVAFVDLAPTLFSLLGIDIPEQMQGRPFLGKKREQAAKDEMEFLFGDRFDEIVGMRRGLTDGRWKYIRRFTPHIPAAPYSFYQFSQDGWVAYYKAWKEGKLKPEHARIWESPQPVEELFDTQSDPWEIHNLAGDPAHAERLKSMREALKQRMIETRDTGLIPESMFKDYSGKDPISKAFARYENLPALVELAFAASSGDPAVLPKLVEKLKSEDMLTRYWATHGFMVLGKKAKGAEEALIPMTEDPVDGIRIAAGHALHLMGHDHAEFLRGLIDRRGNDMAQLAVTNSLWVLGLEGGFPKKLTDKMIGGKDDK
ncbi:MAG: sulfatase-like hydrolase/transferase [Akkermansiaceae bacterium]|nr:sulfatase-like hydrolase/transferase [Akkermansiaceae bacterium]